jgi:hypothetical protein
LEKLGIKSGRRTELRRTIRSSLIDAEKLIPSMGYPSLIKPAIAALANDSALLPKGDKAVVGPAIEALENLRSQVIGAYTGGERPEVLAAEAKARDETRAVVVKAIGYDFQRMTAATRRLLGPCPRSCRLYLSSEIATETRWKYGADDKEVFG